MSALRAGPGRWPTLAFAVLGLAVGGWLWVAVPQRDAAQRDARGTREALIVRAREISKEFGLAADDWRATAKLSAKPRSEDRFYSDSETRSTLARPVRFADVVLIDPRDGERRVSVRLGEDGRLLGWEIAGKGSEDNDSSGDGDSESEQRTDSKAAKPVSPAALGPMVRLVVQHLAGVEAERFRPISSRPPEPDGSYELEEQDPASSRLVWQIRLAFSKGHLVKASLQPDVDEESLLGRLRWHLTTGDLRVVGSLVVWIVGFGAVLIGFQSLQRRSFNWRWFAVCAAVFAGLLAPSAWLGAWSDDLAVEFAKGSSAGLWEVLGRLFVVAWCAWVVLVAEARSQRFGGSAAWASMRMALSGRWRDAWVARSVAAGIGAGALMALCRIAPEMLWTPEPHWRALDVGGLSPGPVADALASFAQTGVVAAPLFALVWAARFRTAWLRALLMLIPAALLAMQQTRTDLSAALLLWSALAGGALTVVLYSVAGALAVVIALPAAWLWLAGSATGAQGVLWALAGLGIVGLLGGLREAEPVDARWTPVDEADLPSTRREKLKAEFTDAREAQQRMLPSTAPDLPGYEVAAVCIPAADVSGDLYDFHALPDGRTLLSVADVSGKGMPAALYMTLCKGVLAAICEEASEPARIAMLANRNIHAAGGRGRGQRKVFITAALAALRPESGEVEIVRAGHNPPLLANASDGMSFVKPSGLAFGLVGPGLFDPRLTSQKVSLAPGATLVLYSDGITEAMDREGNLFGEERLAETLRAPSSARELCTRIVEAVNTFVGGAAQHDDMTLVVVRRTA